MSKNTMTADQINDAVVMIRRANTTAEIREQIEVIESQVTGLGWHALSLIDDADLSDSRPSQTDYRAEDGVVVVEYMPEQHKSSHRAAGNWGIYPLNGATRERMSAADAHDLIDSDEDGYARLV